MSRRVPSGPRDAVDGRRLLRRRPAFGHGETLGPGLARVGRTLHENGAASVAFGVDGDHRPPVTEQNGAGVPEVLILLAIDDDDAFALVGEVEQGKAVGRGLETSLSWGETGTGEKKGDCAQHRRAPVRWPGEEVNRRLDRLRS